MGFCVSKTVSRPVAKSLVEAEAFSTTPVGAVEGPSVREADPVAPVGVAYTEANGTSVHDRCDHAERVTMAEPTKPTPACSPSRSNSTLSSSSFDTFNSSDFGCHLHGCDSAAILSLTDSDETESLPSYGYGYSAYGSSTTRQARARDMENYYNLFVHRHGGGVRTFEQQARRPTAMDLIRMREGANSGGGGGDSRLPALAQRGPYGSLPSDGGGDSGRGGESDAAESKAASRCRSSGRGRPQKVRDPVDAGVYVEELHRFCREKKRGGKIVVDADGEVRRLYPTQGWHRLKSSPAPDGLASARGEPTVGERRRSSKGRGGAGGAGAREEHSPTALASPRGVPEPILKRSSFLRARGGVGPYEEGRPADEEEAELREAQGRFAQRRRVSFAEGTKDFRGPRREPECGENVERPTVNGHPVGLPQLDLLKAKLRTAQA